MATRDPQRRGDNASQASTRSRSQSPSRGAPLVQEENRRMANSDHHPKRGKRPNAPPSNRPGNGRPTRNDMGGSNHSRTRGRPRAHKPGQGANNDRQRSRSRSYDASNPQQRLRKLSPGHIARNRSASRSMSPSRSGRGPPNGARGRSLDPAARHNAARSRSRDPNRNASHSPSRSRSRSGHHPRTRFDDTAVVSKEYPSQQPPRRGRRRARRISRQISRRLRRSSVSVRGKEFTWCQLLHYAIPVSIMIGASVALIFVTGHGSVITDTLGGLIPTLNNEDVKDPFSNGGAPYWPSEGKGLTVTVINALDDKWQSTFSRAVMDWNKGSSSVAKSVSIMEEAGTYDPNCKAPENKIMVCNGDYGETKWRGITESTEDFQGLIYSTTARMNEYYLLNMDSGAWLYTMCHELGHTIGLAHTDENFNNADLGDCMDYTNNLGTNAKPTSLNFQKLFALYGPKGQEGTRRQRQLRGRRWDDNIFADAAFGAGTNQSRTVPAYISAKQDEAIRVLLRRIQEDQDDGEDIEDGRVYDDGWKVVRKREHTEEHEMELGEGFKVRVQLLLAR